MAGRLDYYTEYVDLARFSPPEYQEALGDFLRRKYAGWPLDVIIAEGHAPYEFMARHGAKIFPGVPTVFSTEERDLRPFPNYTGLVFQIEMISEDSLPPGSVVRFKELSFWQAYKGRIIGALVLFALQAALIAVLLVERRRRQHAREALDRLNAELEVRVAERTSALTAKTRELESFAFTVAHDLKAPLRGIDGYGRLLLDGYMDVLDEKGRSLLHTIRSSSTRMSRLIEDLLAYSRIEHRAFAPGRVELRPLVEALVAEKRDEMEARGIELTLSVNGDSVTGDADGLKQALGNYLDNAIKFTRDAARPSIEVGADETDGGGCRLWVRDNGIGFDMKHRERVFEIFHCLRPAGDYPGTGVGLAIARKAAERMGGRAWAESEPGRGSTFYLELPKEGRAPLTASTASPNTPRH